MSDYTITAPTDGFVQLTLTWEDAEVLTRLVGRANSGNLKKFSPRLYDFVLEMVEYVGRDTSDEATNFVSERENGQIYLVDLR